LLSKLYRYNNVTLVGQFNGLECYSCNFRDYKLNIYYIFNRFNIPLGSLRLIGLFTSSHTELRLRLRTGRAAVSSSKYSEIIIIIEELFLANICVKLILILILYGEKCVVNVVLYLYNVRSDKCGLRRLRRRRRRGLRG
jgi:hypothetical protein